MWWAAPIISATDSFDLPDTAVLACVLMDGPVREDVAEFFSVLAVVAIEAIRHIVQVNHTVADIRVCRYPASGTQYVGYSRWLNI